MNRKQRLFGYTAAGIAVGLLLAVGIITTVSRTQFGRERVRRYALKWLTEQVDGTVRLGRLSGSGLLGGVTIHDFAITDRQGRPFLRTDSIQLTYNWRTLVGGDVVVEKSTLFRPEIYFEQLPGDSVWNYQHVFPDRGKAGLKRLILLRDMRVVDGLAIVRMPLEETSDTSRVVIEPVPGGLAQVMRFDSVYGSLSRIIWQSPVEEGKLIDVRTVAGRGFVWREPMHVADMRGTVTLHDTIVGFDMPDARFASSRASIVGRVIMEEGQNFYDVRVDSRSFAFKDLHWLYPRLPDSGGGSGTLLIQSQRPKGTLWLATNTRIAAPGTRVAGSFGVVTGADSLYFTNVDLRASPLNLELVQSMLPRKLPVQGLLVGTVEVKGGLSALQTHGDVQLSNATGSSGVKWHGTLDVKRGLGARDFSADVKTFDLALLNALKPALRLRGQVTGHVEATGNVDTSMKFAADIHHYLSGYTSSFAGTGTYKGGAEPGLDVQMNAQSLSFDELAANYPALERLRGEANGPIRLWGALDDLALTADLQTQGGRAEIEGRLAQSGNVPRYTGKATLHAFQLDRIIESLPTTSVDGKVSFDVAGTNAEDAAGRIGADITSGNVRGVDFRDAHASLKLNGGVAHLDTLTAQTLLGALGANGALGITRRHSGTITFGLRADSVTGVVRATGNVTGSIESFDLAANINIDNLRYGPVGAERVQATMQGHALGGDSGTVTLRGRADSTLAFGIKADSAVFSLDYVNGQGAVVYSAGARDGRDYTAKGEFEAHEQGLMFNVAELRLGHRDHPWRLARPVNVLVDSHGFATDSVDIDRAGGGHVHAEGAIAWHDASHTPEPGQRSDFRLNFRGVPFAEFVLVTAGTSDVQGTLDGNLRVSGNAVAPVLEGDATVNALAMGGASLDRVTASFTYAEQRINARVDAEKSGRRVFFADGIIPANLAFLPVADRMLDEPLRFTMQADSLPATFLTAWIGGFSDVSGRVDGNLLATGTTQKPKLAGSIALNNGSASWDVSGVRYRDVDGTVKLDGERVATVDARLKANGGDGHITGTMSFAQLQNPEFDLVMKAQNFLTAKRRDADLTASGDVTLKGHYRQPRLGGDLQVDHGALFMDELYRRYQIVELDNPLLYDVVDTSIVSLRTILPATLNPFVKNLLVDNLHVGVGRESWLRSRDLNVEVSGDVTIKFVADDTLLNTARTAQDLTLTGTLRAIRGTYQLNYPGIKRSFSIKEGTIEFPGTPGVDPNLAFNAVYRAPSSHRDPIEIVAVVGGTLRTPTVHLTSDQNPPISESDLASYLFFGLPTYELSPGQTAAVKQGVLATYGYLSTGLQAFAQNFGLFDYVSLNATTQTAPGISQQGAIATLFGGTVLEAGRYLDKAGNVYVAFSQRFGTQSYVKPGVSVEWRFQPTLTGQVFAEDRFARYPDFGIQSSGQLRRVYGFFVFREWSY